MVRVSKERRLQATCATLDYCGRGKPPILGNNQRMERVGAPGGTPTTSNKGRQVDTTRSEMSSRSKRDSILIHKATGKYSNLFGLALGLKIC